MSGEVDVWFPCPTYMQDTHRIRTDRFDGKALEISNQRTFSVTVTVRTRNGAPFGPCRVCIRLVTEDDHPVLPMLAEEDRRFPLLVRPDIALTGAPPVEVPDTGEAVFRLQLGQKALSSRINDRRFKLLACLDVPPEILRAHPNLIVTSPAFRGITRLRPSASERRDRAISAQLSENVQLRALQERVDTLEETNDFLRKRTARLEDCLHETDKRVQVLEALSMNPLTGQDLRSAPTCMKH